ncbi:hypothetical protein ACWOFR_00940 [Carnobacterium gallinarum]|uniref:hypothetical protein n=1 Tax=Carnobacterium gallinarum TaxID=2749 RepID=UPI000558000A|nr:hypothetical protein [Carnobacterium gallinarum]
MDKDEYTSALNQAKKERELQSNDLSNVEKVEISAFTDSLDDIKTLELNSTIGIQGVVIESNSRIDIDEKLERADGNTRLVVLVNDVLYGDPSLVGQQVVIYQAGGYVTKRQQGLNEKFPDMSEVELDEEVFTEFNHTHPSEVGTELVGYLALISDEYRKLDYPYYDFLAISLSRFEKNEDTEFYEQVNETPLEELPVDSDLAKQVISINEEINEIVAEE